MMTKYQIVFLKLESYFEKISAHHYARNWLRMKKAFLRFAENAWIKNYTQTLKYATVVKQV